MPKLIFSIIQIILSLALIFLVTIQAKGVGLSAPFGGQLGNYATKRGVEKVVFNLTITLAVLFFLSSFVQLLIG